MSDLRWRGNFSEAYRLASDGLDTLVDDQVWDSSAGLAAAAIEVVADDTEIGSAQSRWLERAQRWHSRFETNTLPTLHGEGLHASATANLARAMGENDVRLWRIAIDSWTGSPYFEAKAKWRLARALTESNPVDPEINELLGQAQGIAEDLNALPLLKAVQTTRENTSQ